LLRNGLYLMSVTVTTSLFGFVYWLVAARRFPADEVGVAAALVAAMTLCSMLSNLGVNTALVQRLPRREDGTPWSTTLNVGLLTSSLSSLVFAVLAVVLLPLISSDVDLLWRSDGAALVFVAGTVATTVVNLLDHACVAERDAKRTLLRNLVFSIAKIPLLFVPSIAALGSYGLLLTWTAATIATVALGFLSLFRLRRAYRFSVHGARIEFVALRRYIAGHHLINIGSFAPWWLLPVFVTAQVSAAATAYFYAAWRVSGLLYMIAPALSTSLAAEGARRATEVRVIGRRTLRMILWLLIPGSVLLAVAGESILQAFGSEYASQGFPLLLLFIAAALPDALVAVYTSILRVEGRLRFGGWLQLGMATFSLAFAWFLLPTMGIVAAGIGWLIARACGCLVIAVDVHRRHGPLHPTRRGRTPESDTATTIGSVSREGAPT